MDNSIKSNRVVKISVICLIVAMVFVTIFAIIFFNGKKTKSMAANVEDLYNEINSDIEEMATVSPEVAMSSNPFKYIENSEGYDKLVNLGVEALPALDEFVNEADGGLSSYILAIAMEDIANCSVYEATGIDWSTSTEFASAWVNFKNNATEKVEDIIRSDESTKNKLEQIKAYGVFAVPAIDKVEDSMTKRSFSSVDNDTMKKLSKYRDSFNLSTDEIDTISEYIGE